MRIRVLALFVALFALLSCSDSTAPRAVILAGRFTDVSAGGGHACALDTLRQAWCWGSNGSGAVGVTVETCTPLLSGNPNYGGCIVSPKRVTTTLRFTQISAGRYHTCGVATTGEAYCWGSNASGQLGSATVAGSCGTGPCSSTPVLVEGGFTFKSIAAGRATTCGITTTNVGKCWGALLGPIAGPSTPATRSTPTTVTIPATNDSLWNSFARPGETSACGITGADRPLCWGDPSLGQLGVSDPPPSGNQPPTITLAGISMPSVTVGLKFACGLDATGAAFCWGAADRDALGLNEGFTGVSCGTTAAPVTCYAAPTRVGGAYRFTSITAGVAHVCGIRKDIPESRCWGSDIDFAIGVGNAPYIVQLPYPVSGQHPFVSVSAGDQFSCGLTTDANVWCWGSNRAGQVGVHPLDGRRVSLFYTSEPQPVAPTIGTGS